jgi:hypothetical protein
MSSTIFQEGGKKVQKFFLIKNDKQKIYKNDRGLESWKKLIVNL